MTIPKNMNSQPYWDQRFSTDWESLNGPAQSRGFAWLALHEIPEWLLLTIRQDDLTVVDWGCAQGDGTDVWASYMPASNLHGVDFSATAIGQALKRYPNITFECSDWLSSEDSSSDNYDIVFSSNTLEHFREPYAVLARLAKRARKAVVLLLPYREINRIDEHDHTFLPENIPAKIAEDFSLIWSRVSGPHAFWEGEQILLIYARNEWISKKKISLNEISIAKDNSSLLRNELVACQKKIEDLAEIQRKNVELEMQLADEQSKSRDQEEWVKTALAEIEQANELLQVHKIQIDSLQRDITMRDAEQPKIHPDLKMQADNLQKEIMARDAEAAQLRHDLKLQIDSLQKEIATRDVEASQLRHDLKMQIDNVQKEITARDAEASLLCNDLKKHIDSLQKEIIMRDAEAVQLRSELKNFRASASWRITSPLRGVYKTISKVGAPVFTNLPVNLQKKILHKVNPVAHPVLKNTVQLVKSGDMPWEVFSQKVLARRNKYKGVFIQEPVIDWSVPLYQRPQHIAVAMARKGYLVIYRTSNWAADDVNGFREVEKNVWITNCDEVDNIDGVVRSIYSTAYATAVENIRRFGEKGQILYEYIDHIDGEISGDENIQKLMSLKDFAFSGGADYIVASAQKLYDEAKSTVGENKTIMVRNGVDVLHYRNPSHKVRELPKSLIDFKKRFKFVVGYFGALAPWLWYETIAELAEQRSDVGFVFIGPDYYGGVEKLPKFDNILYLGTIDYKILPSFGMSFDVCFIPFKPGDIAKTTSPLKLFEYFALERPVVVTSDMAECVAYPEVFHGASAEELSLAIDQAIAVKDDAAFKARLSELADENSWDMRAASLIAGLKN